MTSLSVIIKQVCLFVLCLVVHIYCTAEETPKTRNCNDGPCYARNRTQRDLIATHLATKTPYRCVANTQDQNPIEYAGCQPTRIWSMIRHGTRNPNRRILRAMEGRLREVRDAIVNTQADTNKRTLCDNDRELFDDWLPSKRPDDEMGLVYEGEQEMRELADRMQLRFPSVLPDIWHNDSYRVSGGMFVIRSNVENH